MHTKPTPEEFDISADGIVHQPTAYTFIPFPGSPGAGSVSEGKLGCALADGRHYRPDDVKQMAHKLWAAFVLRAKQSRAP